MVDVFCRNGNGGVLDKYASEFGNQEHLGVYFYAYLNYTYPVPNVNYRDCASQSAIDAPLFGLIDKIVADGLPGTFAPRHSAMCFAYQVRFHDLRHTAAKPLLSQGVDPRTIMETLGPA